MNYTPIQRGDLSSTFEGSFCRDVAGPPKQNAPDHFLIDGFSIWLVDDLALNYDRTMRSDDEVTSESLEDKNAMPVHCKVEGLTSESFCGQSDESVFWAAQDGDQDAFGELLVRSAQRFTRWVSSRTQSIEHFPGFSTEDILQTTCMTLLGKPSKLHQMADLRTFFSYFQCSLKNKIVDGYRKKNRALLPLVDTEGNPIDPEDESPDWTRDKEEILACFKGVIAAAQKCLSPDQLKHLQLHYEGKSSKEKQADLSKSSVSAVNSEWHRIKKAINDYLRKHPELLE